MFTVQPEPFLFREMIFENHRILSTNAVADEIDKIMFLYQNNFDTIPAYIFGKFLMPGPHTQSYALSVTGPLARSLGEHLFLMTSNQRAVLVSIGRWPTDEGTLMAVLNTPLYELGIINYRLFSIRPGANPQSGRKFVLSIFESFVTLDGAASVFAVTGPENRVEFLKIEPKIIAPLNYLTNLRNEDMSRGQLDQILSAAAFILDLNMPIQSSLCLTAFLQAVLSNIKPMFQPDNKDPTVLGIRN